MPFSSQAEAKQFLADKIIAEAGYQGEPLSEVEKRLLLFSMDEPETAHRIPQERLFLHRFWQMPRCPRTAGAIF